MTLDLDALEKVAQEAKSRNDRSFGFDDFGDLSIGAGAVLALIAEVRNRWELIENYTREYPRECNKRVKAEAERDALQAKLDALEAATVEPEWEYGMQDDLGLSYFASLDESKRNAEFQDPTLNPCPVRRRKAGPWEPVGGESA